MALQWRNRQSQNFNGPDGTRIGPAQSEVLDLVNDDGDVVLSVTDDGNGNIALSLNGDLSSSAFNAASLTQDDEPVLTNTTGLRVAHAKYDFAVDGGVTGLITPVDADTIPDNAIMVGGTINSPTAVTSDGSATLAIGTAAGSAADAIKDATAKASYSADALLDVVPTFDVPVKMTAAGRITFTIGTADLTAGVVEVWVFYVVAAG